MESSLLETDPDAFHAALEDGFGLGAEKMDQLRELYRSKAMALGMYYDDEAIAAVYRLGLADGARARNA